MSARVLIVSPFGPPHRGGLETYVDWLTAALSDRGHEVRVFGSDVREMRADYAAHAIDIPVAGGTAWPLVLPTRPTRRTIHAAVAWADLVVHQNCFWDLTWLVAEAARANRVAQRTIVHAAYATYPGAGVIARAAATAYSRTLGRRQLRLAPAITQSSSATSFVRREYGCDATLVPCPLPALPSVSGVRLAAGEVVRIGWLGRLAPVKDPLTAVQVVSGLRQTVPANLVMFGEGPLLAGLPRRHWLRLPGALPRAAALRDLARCHVYLSTSLADSAQLSLIEALALGRPSVATSVGDASEYLTGALAVGLARAGDVTGITSALRAVIADWERLSPLAAERGRGLIDRHDPMRAASDMVAALGLSVDRDTRA